MKDEYEPEEYPFLLKENVRILLVAYREVHKKIFGFSWRKIFPFSLYFRRVDYTAYSRILVKIADQLDEQSDACRRPPSGADSTTHLTFYHSLELYISKLKVAVEQLREIALQILDKASWKSLRNEMDIYSENCELYTKQAHHLNTTFKALHLANRTTTPEE